MRQTTKFNVLQAKLAVFIECVNFIVTQFNVRQTTQLNVSQAKLAGFIECVNFIATQFNVRQTTQFNVSQAKLAGFIAKQFNVSLSPYSSIHTLMLIEKCKLYRNTI